MPKWFTLGDTKSGKPREYVALGILYLLIMVIYLCLAERKKSAPELRQGYLLFAIGYIFFSASYLLGSADVRADDEAVPSPTVDVPTGGYSNSSFGVRLAGSPSVVPK